MTDHDDNPEWTDADFDRAKPAAQVLPAGIAMALIRNKVGRPIGSNKEQVSLRIDRDVLQRFRASGPGWQSRMNEALRSAAGL
jgi:uncharacterized protein (DUF4415 family)